MASLNRILIDSRFRQPDSTSTSDFRVELPETVLLDDGIGCVVFDICVPLTWYTVEENVNDKGYFRLYQADGVTFSDYIMPITTRTA